jgi:hypothetical protein
MTSGHRFIDSLGNVVEGRERMRAGWAAYFTMVPDYSIAVEEVIPQARDSDTQTGSDNSGGVVVILGVARGTYSPDGTLTPENQWKTPIAVRAQVKDGFVAEWRVYADNEPIRALMMKRSQQRGQ